jgi:hypothetical protein
VPLLAIRMLRVHNSSCLSFPIGTNASAAEGKYVSGMRAIFLQSGFVLLAAISAVASPAPKEHADQGQTLTMRLEAPESDVVKAVQEVTQDQIIHGTFSYEKERILYGAHSADSTRPFGVWQGQGKVFYKVAGDVLAPRYFKDSGDIGTISVRYVVQEAGPAATTVQIDAIFVDARNARHASEGVVESSEYAAILKELNKIQVARRESLVSGAANAARPTQSAATLQPPTTAAGSPSPLLQQPSALKPAGPANGSSASPLTIPELEARVEALRHEVELRVKDSGAQLKAAPFRSSATLESLPAQAEVVIVVLTPYWYGVETEDGHHGWVHHSQLEPLP